MIARFGADISNFMSGIQQMVSASSGLASHIGSVASSAGSGFLSMGRSVVGAVEGIGRFVFFAKYAAEGAVGLATAFLGQNAAMEQTRIAFVGLLGSGQAADAMLRQLQSFAAATPFEFTELTKDTQMLIGMGFAARDVIPIMTAVGDAASGVGAGADGVNRITLALGQMQARGKVTGQDMMQMTEAGIPAWRILADSMHLTVAQVQKLSETGKLGADSVTALWHGMEKMYGGQMAGQAGTFNGLLSTLHDNAVMALMAFAGPVFAMAKSGLQQLVALTGSPAHAAFATTMGVQVAAALARVVTFIQQTVTWIQTLYARLAANGTLTAFRDIASSLGQILMNVVNAALLLFGIRLQDIGTKGGSAKSSAQGVADAIRAIAAVIGTVVGGLASLTALFADGGIKGDLFRAALWGVVAAFATWKAIQIGVAIANFISLLPTMLGLTVLWATETWAVAAATIAATWPIIAIIAVVALLAVGVYLLIRNWGTVVAFLRSVWGACVTWLMGTLSTLGTWFADRWNEIKAITMNALNTISGGVSRFVQGVIGFFTNLWHALVGGSIVPDMVNGIIDWFMQLSARALSMIASMVANAIMKFLDMRSQAISTVQNLVSGVAGALGQLAGIAASAGAAFISSLVGQINAGVGWVASAVGNLVSSIWNMMPHSPAKEGPLRDLDKFGPALTGGFAAGIRRGLPEVRTAAQMMVEPVRGQVVGSVASAAPTPTTRGGNREIVDALLRIERKMSSGGRITSDDIMNAFGRQIMTSTGSTGGLG